MARSVNVNFRMDSDLKKNMESLYGFLGIPKNKWLGSSSDPGHFLLLKKLFRT